MPTSSTALIICSGEIEYYPPVFVIILCINPSTTYSNTQSNFMGRKPNGMCCNGKVAYFLFWITWSSALCPEEILNQGKYLVNLSNLQVWDLSFVKYFYAEPINVLHVGVVLLILNYHNILVSIIRLYLPAFHPDWYLLKWK